MFYSFMVTGMAIVDPKVQNQSGNSFSTSVQGGTPNEEFDLGITQVGGPETASSPSDSGELSAPMAQDATFDFSLDLPDTYSKSEEALEGFSVVEPSSPSSEVQNQMSPMVQPQEEEPVSESMFAAQETPSPLKNELLEQDSMQSSASMEGNANPLMEQPLSDEEDSQFSFSVSPVSESTILLSDETSLNPNVLLEDASLADHEVEDSLAPDTENSVPEDLETSDMMRQTLPEAQQPTLPVEATFIENSLSQDTQVPLDNQTYEEQPQGKVLNLDEMISQFSKANAGEVSPQSMQSQMDPFAAMKVTLDAHHQENATVQIDSTSPSEASVVEPLATSQSPLETPPAPQQTPVSQASSTPTLNLDLLTNAPVNPLTNPVSYPPSLAPSPKVSQKKLTGAVFGVLGVVLVGVIAFLRYPDLFMLKSIEPNIQTSELGSGETLEHNAAELSGTLTTGDQLISETDSELLTEFPSLDIESLPSEEPESDIQMIDLSGEASDLSTSQNSESQNPELVNSGETVDPLGAVEGLVGPIDNADLMKQEIMTYQQKGLELKEMGTSQNKRTMMKYGLAVEKEAQKLLDQLANGENIDISTWSAQKIILDDYLVKATNA